jgi:MerR family transcriptional regulator/heat shock protein HspR
MDSDHHPLFTISSIATMLDIHPQTLRLYDRQGFVTPARTKGNTRMYSWQDVAQLRLILHLTRDLGVNLAGVEVILRMQQQLTTLHQEIDRLRHKLAAHRLEPANTPARQRALIKASSRMLVKVS